MTLQFWPVAGIGEIVTGDNLAQIIVEAPGNPLADGDVVIVTSKIVSKAAGLATTGDRDDLMAAQTDRIVAKRGPTTIVRTHHGLTMAAAGIDASNIAVGSVIPLPPDPDHDANDLRRQLYELAGVTVGVIITDTSGRAWRIGQTDIAIGVSGIKPYLSFNGAKDAYGNVLAVTAPAIADEIAGAADLVAEKLGGIPVVVARGLPADWLHAGDGQGAVSLIRDENSDLFGLGSLDAVLAAAGHGNALRGFPMPAGDATTRLIAAAREGTNVDLADVRMLCGGVLEVYLASEETSPKALIAMGVLAERLRILTRAMRVDIPIMLAAVHCRHGYQHRQ